MTGRFRERLATLVNIDSGSGDLDGLAKVASCVAGWCDEAGLRAELRPVAADGEFHGDAVVARRHGGGRGRILLAGHLDTVFAAGEAGRRPFTVRGDRAFGPGVCDDKGGIVAGIEAMHLLKPDDYAEIVLVATPDEEIGSPGSRRLLDELAGRADAALCLECARDNGDLVHARKGMTDVRITLRGRAAHAGIEPHRGANAALAAARLTVALQQLNGRWPDVTVNVGVLRAGERPNIIAAEAHLLVDVRAASRDLFDAAVAAITEIALSPTTDGVRAGLELIAPTPPWHTDPTRGALLDVARAAGDRVGVDVRFAATGGCADANLIAATGLPVLDGLGPIGGADHSAEEWLDLASVTPRVALLAEIIRMI